MSNRRATIKANVTHSFSIVAPWRAKPGQHDATLLKLAKARRPLLRYVVVMTTFVRVARSVQHTTGSVMVVGAFWRRRSAELAVAAVRSDQSTRRVRNA